jgi:hypothetical protein
MFFGRRGDVLIALIREGGEFQPDILGLGMPYTLGGVSYLSTNPPRSTLRIPTSVLLHNVASRNVNVT